MKNTNPIFSLKNFRSFGEEGADFELAPITVLTGCNSAGKSSLVKALMLLSKQSRVCEKAGKKESKSVREALTQKGSYYFPVGTDIERNIPSTELKVYFKELGLGRFDKIINRNSKDDIITITYKIMSYYINEELIVKRVFKAEKDILNGGKLIDFSIEKQDGSLIYRYFWNNEIQWPFADDPDPKWHNFKYPYGWDELDNINSIKTNCDNFSIASQYYELKKHQNRLIDYLAKQGLFLSEKEMSELEMRDQKVYKYINDKKNKLTSTENKIEELENKLGKEQVELLCSEYDEKTMRYWNSKLYSFDEYDTPTGDGNSTRDLLERLGEEGREARIQNNFMNCVINECVSPMFIYDIDYVDSSSATVKRLYSVEDENKMCVALGKLVKNGRTGSYVNKWLRMFGIADSIEVLGTNEGIGIMVYLIRGDEKYLLADEGYGITQLVSLFLQMENTIVNNTKSRTITDHETYEETLECYYLPSFIAIEEPEVHLHPKYQSLLADMFVEAYQKYNIHFIIETHSEYLIRKLQVLVADKENKLTPNDVSLNYVDKDENGISTNRKIEILEDGRLSGPFGPGFFDEADSLAMDLMRYKVRR